VTKFLLAVHVIAAIVAVGPVTVAASLFPPAARKVLDAPADVQALATTRLLHRICRVYAAVVLAALVLPRQSAILEGTGDRAATVRLAMFTGIFNLLWATVTVLMIIRPGSTTGA
jgi:uncharacterized membrane protein